MADNSYFAVDDVIDYTVNALSESSLLEDVRFVHEFPASKKGNPISGVIVSVGMKSFNYEYSAFGEYMGNTADVATTVNGRRVKMIMRLIIHAPIEMGSDCCRSAFARISEYMNESDKFSSAFTSCECGEPVYDRVKRALEMPADFSFDFYVTM